MMVNKRAPGNIDDYLDRYPAKTRRLLRKMRLVIKKAAPQAKEIISYGIPAFTLNGMLVWFAAHKSHIGLYPRASAIAVFKRDLSAYKTAKGSVQFPFNMPLPLPLISRIVRFRVRENLGKKGKKG